MNYFACAYKTSFLWMLPACVRYLAMYLAHRLLHVRVCRAYRNRARHAVDVWELDLEALLTPHFLLLLQALLRTGDDSLDAAAVIPFLYAVFGRPHKLTPALEARCSQHEWRSRLDVARERIERSRLGRAGVSRFDTIFLRLCVILAKHAALSETSGWARRLGASVRREAISLLLANDTLAVCVLCEVSGCREDERREASLLPSLHMLGEVWDALVGACGHVRSRAPDSAAIPEVLSAIAGCTEYAAVVVALRALSDGDGDLVPVYGAQNCAAAVGLIFCLLRTTLHTMQIAFPGTLGGGGAAPVAAAAGVFMTRSICYRTVPDVCALRDLAAVKAKSRLHERLLMKVWKELLAISRVHRDRIARPLRQGETLYVGHQLTKPFLVKQLLNHLRICDCPGFEHDELGMPRMHAAL